MVDIGQASCAPPDVHHMSRTACIKAGSNVLDMWQAYSNRAACYLSQGKYHECIADCSKGLVLLGLEGVGEVSSSGNEGFEGAGAMRVKLWVRRATARGRLGDWARAHQDLDKAAKADLTGNKDLKHDLAVLSGLPPPSFDPRAQALAALQAAGVPAPAGV